MAEVRKAEGDQGTLWRFTQAALLIDKVRRGAPEHLNEAKGLAAEISKRRPQWSGGFALNGELAELSGSPDQAISFYVRAVELGNVQPSLVRRLVMLLNERNRFDEIEHVAQVLRDQGAAISEVTIVRAVDALREGHSDQGLELARQLFPLSSTNSSDHLALGRFYAAAGRSDEAGQEFRRAVDLGRGVPDNWLAYVQHLVETKRIDQARSAIDAVGKALPADRSALTLARCWLLVGDLAQAELLSQRVLNVHPRTAPAIRLAAGVALGRNRSDQVAEYLTQLDRSTDVSPADKAWANRARVALLLRKNRPADQDESLRLVEQNLKNDPTSAEDLALKATVLAPRPRRRGEAIAILEQLAAAKRLGANEQFLLAQLYLGQREEKKYQDEMLKLLGLKPRNPRHLAHYVNHWIDRNHLDQADRWLAELKKTDPRGLPALELEARLLDLRKHKPELLSLLEARGRELPDEIGAVADLLNRYGFAKEAELAYKAFAARDPSQPERSLALAQFLASQDRPTEAIAILEKARTTCRPEQVAAAALAAFDAPSAGEAEKRRIETWLAEAVRKRPDVVSLKMRLGLVWMWQGRGDEAIELFRRLLADSPDDADVLNSLAWLLALRDQAKANEALALINHAIDITGAIPALVDTRAIVLIRAGQFDRALADLRRARAAEPSNPNFALHQAWAYQAKGRTYDARKAFQQAQELGWEVAKSDPLERSFMEKLRQDLARN